MHCKTLTILLRIRVRGHFVMSITKNHESPCVTVLDNPQFSDSAISDPIKFFKVIKAFFQPARLFIHYKDPQSFRGFQLNWFVGYP